MARVIALIDRHPLEPDWKGYVAWELIRSLAESQHQVLALTTLDPHTLTVNHPRLSVARPANSWGVRHLGKFLRAILLFQPEVIYAFAPRPGSRAGLGRWAGFTAWPYLQQASRILPSLQPSQKCGKKPSQNWFSTIFEREDWHPETPRPLVFAPELKDEIANAEVLPLEFSWPSIIATRALTSENILIPAPVSEWRDVHGGLHRLSVFLTENSHVHVQIIGGWGELPLGDRRAGWQIILGAAERVHLLEALSLEQFVNCAQGAQALWLDDLKPNSWRHLVSTYVGRVLNKPLRGRPAHMERGPTANFLSRFFAGSPQV